MKTNTPSYDTSPEITHNELQQVLEMVRDMMGEIHHEASAGAELHGMNIANEWADSIKAIFSAPVKSSYEALQSIEKSIRDMIHEQILEFLHSKHDLIQNVYRVSANQLHYAIVLKEDTIDNEAEIIEFKMNYDETPVSQKIPVIFSFVDEELLEGAQIQEKLTLG